VKFLRRLVQHVLPEGFHKIRHYGLYAGAADAVRRETVGTPAAYRRFYPCLGSGARPSRRVLSPTVVELLLALSFDLRFR